MKSITVDDSATMRRIIKKAQKSNGNEDVIEAENGQAGPARIQAEGLEMVQAISAGVNGHIVKPFEPDTLHTTMQRVPGA